MSSDRMILLNPGPVTLTDRVRAALGRGDWCHREAEFAALTQEINSALVNVYPLMADTFDAVMLTGSGTSAVEAMLASFAPTDSTTMVIANGVYGERMADILAAHGKPYLEVKHPWTAPLDLEAIAGVLDQQPEITHVATVHHETTTGRLNDLDGLGRICRERQLPLLLDGVSSFGAEEIDADGWNLAAVAATANKCLHGVPGLSFVLGRKSLFAAAGENPTSVYLDLHRYHAGQHGDGYSPFTQSVQVAFALREALAELAETGGWQARRDEYRRRADRIEKELARENISTLLNNNDYSCVLWAYMLPEGVSYTQLHDRLKAAGFVIYAGQGEFARSVFRIAHMGDIHDSDLDLLCLTLRQAVQGPVA